jgi:hypothetical protein
VVVKYRCGKPPIPDYLRILIGKVHNTTSGYHGVERTMIKIPILTHPFTTSRYYPMESLNIDFVGPYPDGGYVFVVICTFTRWVELWWSANAMANEAANHLLQHFGRFGGPT